MTEVAPAGLAVHRGWHLTAVCVLLIGAAANAWPWFALDRMPPGDFPGYVAQVQYVRDALLAHGRVPNWCVPCLGGASQFTSNLKEYLAFPLAVALEPVLATKLTYLLLRVLGGLGLYWLSVRLFAAPLAGIVAGYAAAFGAIQNHHLSLLDLALASALLPPIVVAAAEVIGGGSAVWVVVLGTFAAALLVNNWIYALPVPVAIAAMMLARLLRPGSAASAMTAWRRAGVARVAAAFGVTLVLAASTIAWLVAYARQHALLDPTVIERARLDYIHRSPFLLVNRDDGLASWLKHHQPPGLDITVWDKDTSYVGIVVLGSCLIAWPALRRRRELLGWARLGLQMSLFVYWLSLGERTLLWQLAWSFDVNPAGLSWLRNALVAASALCVAGAGAVQIARRAKPAAWLARRRASRLLWTSLALLVPAVPLWSVLAAVLPPFQVQRSPGHFFETLPFWLTLAFAAALAALGRAISSPRLALAVVAAIGIATAIDFAPTARTFAAGHPMEQLDSAAAKLRELDGEGGTIRLAIPQNLDPQVSWILAQATVGQARNWLTWQAGEHWNRFFRQATRGYEQPVVVTPRVELMELARVQYFLVPRAKLLQPPWRLREGWDDLDLSELKEGNLRLWELPAVGPMASAYRSYSWLEVEPKAPVANRIGLATLTNSLLLSAPRGSWEAPPRDPPGPPPFPVTYQRPSPEHIVLDVDAGPEPALIFVSESHHPWWRAAIDGQPGMLLRAHLTFMAVPVAAGAHRIDLRFVPPLWLRFVDHTSQLACVALVLAAPVFGWRSLRSGPRRSAYRTRDITTTRVSS